MSTREEVEGTTRERLHASDSKVTDEVLESYLTTLLWSEALNACDAEGNTSSITWEGTEYKDGTPLDDILDTSDLPDEVREEAREDLCAFERYCVETIGLNPFRFFDAGQVAHDFCLSRNGHGAGFFDDPYDVNAKGPNGTEEDFNLSDELQAAAETFGTFGLSVWVNGEGDNAELKVESHS